MSKPRPHDQTHTTIICIDCGAPRTVRNQDKHQVIRCIQCQRVYRLNRRNELRNSSNSSNGATVGNNEISDK